jgi:type II secretory pathway pseudopilin PulG
LIVTAILALLAAILFPVFDRAREGARRSSCQSNLKQIGIAFSMYAQDYDDQIPTRALGNVDVFTRLNLYLRNKQVWECKSQTTTVDSAGVEHAIVPNTANSWNFFSYGLNADLAGNSTNITYVQYHGRELLLGEIRGLVDRSFPLNHSAGERFWPAMRHFEGTNILFMDYHVKWYPESHPGLTCKTANNATGTFWAPTAASP